MDDYTLYKDSGLQWIGEIPSHWALKKLNLIFDFTTGFTPATGNSEYYDNGDVDWVTIADMNEKYICHSDSKITHKAIEAKIVVPKGSLMYSFKLSVGKVGFAGKDLYTNEAIFSIFPKDGLCLDYFYYQLPHVLIYNANENIYGAKLLNQELIKASKLVLPPYEEQLQIANYLDYKTAQIDKLISDKEKLIELLNEERKAIINQAVTKGIDPDAPMKDSGVDWLGEVPEHWSMKRVKNVVKKVGSGVTPKGGAEVYLDSGIPLLRSQNVYFDGFRLDEVAYISQDVHDGMNNSKVVSNDILLNITGGSIGRCYYVTNEFEEANVNQHVCIIRPNELILTKFLYNYLRSESGQLQIDICQIGGNRESVNFEQLKNFNIPLPDTNEQDKIVEFIDTFERKIVGLIEKTKAEISLLKEYKTALISEVVTGKVDVRNELIPETENLNLAS